jgi:RimJ/RimL family protein N-acetyltransferase
MVTTKRLTITDTCTDDFPEIKESLNDKYIQANVIGIPTDLDHWLNSDGIKLTVRLKDTNELVGVMCVNIFSSTADIGGWCCKKFRNNGYAHEVYKSVADTLYKNGIHKLTANCLKGNRMAIYLLESLNFVFNTTLKEHCVIGPKYHDILLYEKIARLKA